MKICLCCKQNEIKPTFSFCCRWCYIYLHHRYGIGVMDYLIYFETMYSKKVPGEDCEYKGLYEIHNHFLYNLRTTDKQLAGLLETILFSKVVAVNWENSFNFRLSIYDGETARILN